MVVQNPVILTHRKSKPLELNECLLPNNYIGLISQIRVHEIFENGGQGDCGLRCLKQLYIDTEDLNLQLMQFTNVREYWSGNELGRFAQYKGWNLIIISNFNITYYRGNVSNKFGCILASDIIDDRLHWVCCNFEVLSVDNRLNKTNVNNEFYEAAKKILNKNITLDEAMNYAWNPQQLVQLVNLQNKNEYDVLSDKIKTMINMEPKFVFDNINKCYTYVTSRFTKPNLNSYIQVVNDNNIINAPCGFGKTTQILNLIKQNESLTIILPLIKAVLDITDHYDKQGISVVSLYRGKEHYNKPNTTIKLVVTTIDSYMKFRHNVKLYTTHYYLDEIHEMTANYFDVCKYLQKHIAKKNLLYGSGTLSHTNIINETRHPLNIFEYKTKSDIPPLEKIIKGKTAVVLSTIGECYDYLDQHKKNSELKNIPATILHSKLLQEKPDILTNNYQVYYTTDCIGVGVNWPQLTTIVDYGLRLNLIPKSGITNEKIDIDIEDNKEQRNIKVAGFRYHSIEEKIQMQRRIGRYSEGFYYGLLLEQDNSLTFEDYIKLSEWFSIPTSFKTLYDYMINNEFKEDDMKELQEKRLNLIKNKIDDLKKKIEVRNNYKSSSIDYNTEIKN